MTHADKGKYNQKHRDQTISDDILKKDILLKTVENSIACNSSEEIARARGLDLGAIGVAIDLLNINIIRCQLGLFGYSPEKKIVQPAKEIDSGLKEEIGKSLVNGRLPCVAAWEIAQKLSFPRMGVSAACEALQIRIKPCQLGAF